MCYLSVRRAHSSFRILLHLSSKQSSVISAAYFQHMRSHTIPSYWLGLNSSGRSSYQLLTLPVGYQCTQSTLKRKSLWCMSPRFHGSCSKETRMNGGMSMLLAEIASCQMEYKYLTYLTGREEFFTTVGLLI